MGPRVLGLFFVQMHFLVNTILASGLRPGSLAVLDFAWLLMLLPQGVFAQVVATAVFPTFAAQIAAGDRVAMRVTLGQTLRATLFLTIPAAIGLYVLRFPLIKTLFQRYAFDAEATQRVAYALQFYTIGLVGHAVVEIGVRAFYALHNTMTPMLVGIGTMMLNILLAIWWVRGLNFAGLALANSVATSLEMGLLLWLLHWRLGTLQGTHLAGSALRLLLAALVMGLATWLWLRLGVAWLLPVQWTAISWLLALSGLLLAAAVYFGASLLLNRQTLWPLLVQVLPQRLLGRNQL